MHTVNLDEANNKFYSVYGRAMAAWSELERGLAVILVRVAGLTPQLAGAIYYSANSFQGRTYLSQLSEFPAPSHRLTNDKR